MEKIFKGLLNIQIHYLYLGSFFILLHSITLAAEEYAPSTDTPTPISILKTNTTQDQERRRVTFIESEDQKASESKPLSPKQQELRAKRKAASKSAIRNMEITGSITNSPLQEQAKEVITISSNTISPMETASETIPSLWQRIINLFNAFQAARKLSSYYHEKSVLFSEIQSYLNPLSKSDRLEIVQNILNKTSKRKLSEQNMVQMLNAIFPEDQQLVYDTRTNTVTYAH